MGKVTGYIPPKVAKPAEPVPEDKGAQTSAEDKGKAKK